MDSIPGSLEEVCDVARYGSGPPRWLIEVPHGATRRRDFEGYREQLRGDYPPDLEAFFFVNTDVGAPECADATARGIVRERGLPGLVVRGRIPRTFVDCNRVIEPQAAGRMVDGLTPGLPGYVREPRDVELLLSRHRDYQRIVDAVFDTICGSGGAALILHTYAPRSVELDRIDDDIVPLLRAAYRADRYSRWTRRPDIDVISETLEGKRLAPDGFVDALTRDYAALQLEVRENATYRLHPSTTGYRHSSNHPGRVACVEINRALLAQPFTPFEEMEIPEDRAVHLSGPLAAALGALAQS